MSTVIAKNIPQSVTVEKVQEFFSFCGEVKAINLIDDGSKKSYQIVFKQEKALLTALLLNEAELDGGKISVEKVESVEETPPAYDESTAKPVADNKVQASTFTGDANYDDIEQEEKPKYAIMAQMLSHGYKVSDDLVEKAIKFDKENGFSSKFKNFVKLLDDRYIHLNNPESTSNQLLNNFKSLGDSILQSKYFTKVANHPYGVKVHDFYKNLAGDVKEVHTEAKRLSALKREQELQKKQQTAAEGAGAEAVDSKPEAVDTKTDADIKF